MVGYGYTSRNIPDSTLFERVYHDRLQAKREGNKKISDTLKLVLNTSYGCMLNQYNNLFDPLMGRSVCITGQLFLTELAMSYLEQCATITIIQINTDGIMFSIDDSELFLIKAINEEWQERTGFILEEDKIKKIIQKDVNNYIMATLDGEVKVKGGFLTYGIQDFGSAFNVNNNATIIKKALADYLVKGIDPKETVYASDDIFEFQFIAKAGSKYSRAYQIVYGTEMEIQKVNRVYASKNAELGKLYKVHRETGRPAKIDSLPEYCIIDNDNKLSIKDIDREYYINQTWEKIKDFIGEEVNSVDEYVKLSDLKKVPGIGDKTMERIRESVEVFTEIEAPEGTFTPQKLQNATKDWLDDLLEVE